jgi:hypothetical protein
VPPQDRDHNLLVDIQISQPDSNHFQTGAEPELLIVVTNRNVPPCLLTIEICCDGKDVLVEDENWTSEGDRQHWTSEEKRAEGRGIENSTRTFDAKLKLVGKCKDRSLTIVIKWRRPADAETTPPTPPTGIKKYERLLWVT